MYFYFVLISFEHLQWLQNQAEARKLTEQSEELKDLTANEKNLDWLKEKARQRKKKLFQSKNILKFMLNFY